MRRLWVLTLGLLACGGRGPETRPSPETELARARQLVRNGQYGKALTVFQRLTFEFGASQPEAAEVRYWLAECQFQTRDYEAAVEEFRRAADWLPDSPWAPLALLRAGDAHLRRWRRPELDPVEGEAALALYQELVGRYPNSDAAARAAIHVRQLKELFAEKTFRNGLFYLKRRAYDSAIIYFKAVIANYPETTFVPTALLKLVDAYRAIGYREEIQETCEHLRRYHPRARGLAERCPATPGAS